jgi:signal transduction histidine kinase/ligand-binding sensor domain-containing protein
MPYRRSGIFGRAVRIGLLALCGLAPAWADTPRDFQLPTRTYDARAGLASDSVTAILPDSRGYLWFATSDGVSRFDGDRFTSYRADSGLPPGAVRDLLEARDGTYWFATDGGLVRWRSGHRPGEPGFVPVPLPGAGNAPARALLQDRAGRIWAAAGGRLFILEPGRKGMAAREVPLEGAFEGPVEALAAGADGSLWIGGPAGLSRRLPGGGWRRLRVWPGSGEDPVQDLLVDDIGLLWIAHDRGVLVTRPELPGAASHPGAALASRARRVDLGSEQVALPEEAGGALVVTRPGAPRGVHRLAVGPKGWIWITTPEMVISTHYDWIKVWTAAQGLPQDTFTALAQDVGGNLWLGTASDGAVRIGRNRFLAFRLGSGPHRSVISVVEAGGEIHALTRSTLGPGLYLHRYRDGRFSAARLRLPPGLRDPGRGRNQAVLRDRAGDWWVATGSGLLRYAAPGRFEDLATRVPRRFTTADGLGGDDIAALYEDAQGDLWIGGAGPRSLTVWRRASGAFESFGPEDGLPRAIPAAFAEDAAGNLWIGFLEGGLVRRRQGRFERFGTADGLPDGAVRALLADARGRLWIALGGSGAVWTGSPAAPRPRFRRPPGGEGLAGQTVRCLAEDPWGRVYLGGTRGIDRLDPETGRAQRFTTADGLANNLINGAARDPRGKLWFATEQGLARLEARPEAPAPAPPVWITGVRINGADQPVSELGETEVAGIAAPPGPNQVQIDFLSLHFGPGVQRYQYRLEGVDLDWSPPGERRSVLYLHLPPDRYRFLARAVTASGAVSQRPAVLSFEVRPPLWRRGWFLGLAAAVLAAGVAALYRYRVAHLLAVERMRTGIATDLHDDMGSSLSRISILSEVARRRADGEPETSRLLEEIGDTSRELMGSLSESLWAIDPARDDLRSLVTRLRSYAGDLLDARGIRWRLEAPEEADLRLSPRQRRQLFLAAKEALHNVLKHAGAASVVLTLAFQGGRLLLEVRDDGAGFDPAGRGEDRDRRGLRSLEARAGALGGRFTVETAPGAGTRVRLDVPL